MKKDQVSGATYDKMYWYGISADPIAESDLSGNITDEYVFFGGKRIARRQSNGNIYFYFADHLGTARAIVQSGQSTACYESDSYPFGSERSITNTCPQNYKFTGKERDGESGLDFFIARYYSSGYGRFLIPDWADAPTAVPYADYGNPQSLNLYTYVGNNPITRFDTDGHCWPISDCATKFQNAVDSATQKIVSAAASSGDPVIATVVAYAAGKAGDALKSAAEPFRAGEAVGACMDGCSGVQKADALSKDLKRTAGLVTYAATAVAVGKAVANKFESGSTPPGPDEPYDRGKHYGRTPTKADKDAIGGESVDHDPELVKRYYEGDPAKGEPPGYSQTPEQRREGAADRSRMRPSTLRDQRRQGAAASRYSREKKREYGFERKPEERQ